MGEIKFCRVGHTVAIMAGDYPCIVKRKLDFFFHEILLALDVYAESCGKCVTVSEL